MNRLKVIFSILATFTLSGIVHANGSYVRERVKPKPAINSVTFDKKRTVSIIGSINMQNLKQAAQIDRLVDGSKKPIYMFINSPGGMILAGKHLIHSMSRAKKYGHKIVCATTILSASMAFTLLAHCNERYTFKHTLLLFHPPRIGLQGYYLQDELGEMAKSLNKESKNLVNFLTKEMRMNRSLFLRHYRLETFWEAEDLAKKVRPNYFIFVDEIINAPDIYKYKKGRSFFNAVQKIVEGKK